MKHRFRSHGTTAIENKSAGLVSALGLAAFSALIIGSSMVAGCGDKGDESGSAHGGTQSSSAGSSGKSNAANGGSDSNGDAGETSAAGGVKNTAGAASAGSDSHGGSATNGGVANSGGDDSGAMGGSVEPGTGLGTGDGITGTFDGTVHAHTYNAANAPQQTKTVVIGASSAQYPLYNNWTIRFLPKLGAQACTDSTGTEDTFISFGSQTDYNLNGTTAGAGSCSLDVTSITPNFEGTFRATLATAHGLVEVTDGSFRVGVGKF